jgi:hypothetical protein
MSSILDITGFLSAFVVCFADNGITADQYLSAGGGSTSASLISL